MSDKILIDSNSLVILIIGLIDPNLINSHKRTSIYEAEDFENIISLIDNDLRNVVVLPNTLTEVDNLLNGFSGNRKYLYIQNILRFIAEATEHYLSAMNVATFDYFHQIGLTDSLLLQLAPKCKCLITSDSGLSDYAKALNINVFDLVEYRNLRLN